MIMLMLSSRVATNVPIALEQLAGQLDGQQLRNGEQQQLLVVGKQQQLQQEKKGQLRLSKQRSRWSLE